MTFLYQCPGLFRVILIADLVADLIREDIAFLAEPPLSYLKMPASTSYHVFTQARRWERSHLRWRVEENYHLV